MRVITKLVFCAILITIVSVESRDNEFIQNVDYIRERVYRVEDSAHRFLGTAFCINSSGSFLTCAHVVDSRDTVFLTNYGDVHMVDMPDTPVVAKIKRFVSKVDVRVPELDFAVLQADLKVDDFRRLAYLPFGRSSELKPGEDIAICAFIPDSFELPLPFVSKGIVSTIRRDTIKSKNRNALVSFRAEIIQMDLNISKGTSGGPVFLPSTGAVVAIQDAGMFESSQSSQTSYAIALSIDQILVVLDSLRIPYELK